MPEIVEPDRGEACPLKQRLEGAVDHVLSVEGLAVLGGEYEAVVLPLGTRL